MLRNKRVIICETDGNLFTTRSIIHRWSRLGICWPRLHLSKHSITNANYIYSVNRIAISRFEFRIIWPCSAILFMLNDRNGRWTKQKPRVGSGINEVNGRSWMTHSKERKSRSGYKVDLFSHNNLSKRETEEKNKLQLLEQPMPDESRRGK